MCMIRTRKRTGMMRRTRETAKTQSVVFQRNQTTDTQTTRYVHATRSEGESESNAYENRTTIPRARIDTRLRKSHRYSVNVRAPIISLLFCFNSLIVRHAYGSRVKPVGWQFEPDGVQALRRIDHVFYT